MRISIHAPLAGCDVRAAARFVPIIDFNPRTPCGVRPLQAYNDEMMAGISIHAPLAGCDVCARGRFGRARHFNPRTPCGVRHWSTYANYIYKAFQSTHPLRGATFLLIFLPYFLTISIHAPLAGCDDDVDRNAIFFDNFNPRTPCGVRRSTHSASSPLV